MIMISSKKLPRMWDCWRPAAEMAACSRRASLWDIFWRFLMMEMHIPNPKWFRGGGEGEC